MAFPNSRNGGRGGRNFPNVQIRGGTVRYDQNGNKLPGEWSSNGPIGDPHNVWHPINYDPDTNTPQDRARIAQEQMDAQQAQGQRGAPLLQMNTRGQFAQAGGRADAVKGAPAATGTPLPEPHDSPVGQMRIGADARGTNPYYSRAAGQLGIGANNAPGTAAFAGTNLWTGPNLAQKLPPGSGERVAVSLPGANAIDAAGPHDAAGTAPDAPAPSPFETAARNEDAARVAAAGAQALRTGQSLGDIDKGGGILTRYGPVSVRPASNWELVTKPALQAGLKARFAELTGMNPAPASFQYDPNAPGQPANPGPSATPATATAPARSPAPAADSAGSDSSSAPLAYKAGALYHATGDKLGEALYNAVAGYTGNLEAATGQAKAPPQAQVDIAKDKARGNAKPYNDQAIQWYKDHDRPLPARYAEIQDRYATQPPPPPPTTDEVHAKGVPPESAPAKVPEGPGPDSPNWKDSVLAPNANKVPYASTEDSNSGTYAALRASTTTPPTPSASPTASDPASLPGLPSKAAQWAAALTGKPSEDGPGIVAQPHPTAGPLASPASPPAAASSARTTAPGAIPGASAADQAPRAVEASVAAKPAPADQPAAMRSGRNDSGNAISAAPMPGDARPDPHPSNVGQMRSGPNVGTSQNPLTQDALDDARSQLANRAINHQDFYNLTGRVDAHAAPSARNAAMSDLDSLHQSTAGNAASSTGAPQPQTPGGSMAGSTAVGRNDALSNAVTPGAGADSLTAQTTPGKIQYGGPTSNSDWARMFAPTPVADWSKIGSNHQVAAADSPALAPGPDDEDEKLKQLRAGTADSAAGGDNTTQSPAAQTQDIA